MQSGLCGPCPSFGQLTLARRAPDADQIVGAEHDPDIALRVLTTGMGSKAYRTLRPLLRIFPSFYRFRHSISESNLERDRAIVAAASIESSTILSPTQCA